MAGRNRVNTHTCVRCAYCDKTACLAGGRATRKYIATHFCTLATYETFKEYLVNLLEFKKANATSHFIFV